jgi:hypothetical protein
MNHLESNSLYTAVSLVIAEARKRSYTSVNTILLETYWKVGKLICEDEMHGEKRAHYAKGVLKKLANQLTLEFGKGFDERNLNNMRAFYRVFPIWNAVRTELSWTHYRLLSRIEDLPRIPTQTVHLSGLMNQTPTKRRRTKVF